MVNWCRCFKANCLFYKDKTGAPTRHDNIDFRPVITRISKIKSLSVVVADKGYYSEDNRVMVREKLKGFSIISPRHEKDVPIWKTRGKYKYRKEMKRGYSKILFNQRNKDETIVSVIKRLFGEHISSRLIRMQNRELTFRCITYNLHRMLNLIIIKWILQNLLLRYILNMTITDKLQRIKKDQNN
ncbi:MAG: transposase [Nitrososphaeraceae archaeon]